MANSKFHIGYDIGGTKIEIALLDSNINLIYKARMPTDRDLGYEHILSVLKKLFETTLETQNFEKDQIASIGLALPGSVDPKSHKMLIGNTRVLEGKPIKEDLARILDLETPIFAENDANCFALAEYKYGVGKNLPFRNMMGIILGTGVGGGIVIDGKLYSGRRGAAAEIGHTFLSSVQQTNQNCYCGQKNCAENYISGTGFQKYYSEQTGKQASTSTIFQEEKFLNAYKEDLARFLGTLTNILDPDYFVLGGGVSKADVLYNGLENLLIPHLFYKKDPPKILKHALSDSAGSIGAALLFL